MNYLPLVKILNYRFKVKKSRGHVCKSGLEPKAVNSATSYIHYMRSKVIYVVENEEGRRNDCEQIIEGHVRQMIVG